MAEQEFFSINPSTHIRTTSENRRFYDLLVDEKNIFSTKYQLYTFITPARLSQRKAARNGRL